MIKLLIADDRDIFRDSLKIFLSKTSEIGVVGEVTDGREAMDLIDKNDYDVVLMDIHMPIMNGIEATRNIIKSKPCTKILASSFDIMPDYINEVMGAGAQGFIAKSNSGASFIEAIKAVGKGQRFLTDETESRMNQANVFSF